MFWDELWMGSLLSSQDCARSWIYSTNPGGLSLCYSQGYERCKNVARHGLEGGLKPPKWKVSPPPNKVQPVLHYGLLLQCMVNGGLMLMQSHCVTHNYCDCLSETSWAVLRFSSTVLWRCFRDKRPCYRSADSVSGGSLECCVCILARAFKAVWFQRSAVRKITIFYSADVFLFNIVFRAVISILNSRYYDVSPHKSLSALIEVSETPIGVLVVFEG